MAQTDAKSERIEVRTSPRTKALLQQAAAGADKTVTEFLLDAGLKAAQDALADRRFFVLDDDAWTAFQNALDRPPAHKPRLAKLLTEKSLVEKP